MSINPDDFNYIRSLIECKCGIELSDNHHYLVESRLEPLAEKSGYRSISEMIEKMKSGALTVPICKAIADAMTTNETLFFRDKLPFETLKNVIIPNLLKARESSKKIRIWSAACSSGQEPYSIAMIFLEHFSHFSDWQFEIVATDYSQAVLQKASEGFYTQFEVQRGLTEAHLAKYFTAKTNGWQINERVKKLISFSQFNLIDPSLIQGTFDVIFCRNVLIYFSGKTKTIVFNRLASSLAADGRLILGGAESPLGFSDQWLRIEGEANHMIYQKKPELIILKNGA